MNLNNKQVLIDEQLSKVNAPIFINDVIGDESRCVVSFKGRTTNFIYDENLGDNINSWLDNLPVITVNEIKEVMNKYKEEYSDNTKWIFCKLLFNSLRENRRK